VSPLDAVGQLFGVGRPHRRVWRSNGRAHVEVRGIHRPDAGRLIQDVEADLGRNPAVEAVRALPLLGRIVIQLEDNSIDTSALIELVEEIERDHGVAAERFPAERPDHPGDREPFGRELTALVADGVALGVAVAGRAARLARLPIELAGLVPLVQSQPRLRHRLETLVGRPVVDVSLALTNAAASALAQGPLGLLADAGHRALRLLEIDGANRAWREREPALTADLISEPSAMPSDDYPHPRERPRHNGPTGPADTYADRAGGASALAAAAMLASGQPRRASSLLMAGTPKAARLGPEAFAASLHRVLADRGLVCFDPQALRRLDRVDCALIDAGVVQNDGDLVSGARELVEAAHDADYMVALAGADRELSDRLGADLVVEGGDQLVDSVRMLCDDGCHPLVVAASHPEALDLADVGLGLLDTRGHPPWGAHMVATERGLEDAVFVVEAAAVAHEVSRQSAALSLGGSGIGATLAMTSPPAASPGPSLASVNVASLVAMANGARAARSLAGHEVQLHDAGPPWHALDIEAVIDRLATDPRGLDENEAARRRAELPASKDDQVGLGQAFAEELSNPLTPVLAVGASLSAATGSPTDAGLVGSVVALNAMIGATQRVRVERAVRQLESATAATTARVRRGELCEVPAAELVPGDIIALEAGDAVPADGRILRADNLEMDESSLTGESLTVAKSPEPTEAAAVADRTSMLYEGTAVAVGTAEAVVVAVGPDTELGRAATGDAVVSGGVEERLGALSRTALPLAVAGGLAVTSVGFLRGQPLRGALAPGINLAVAAVPEGLPLLATVAQLSAAKRLAARGALVRNPQAIEALGRVGVLCVDKTGTLTEGAIELGTVTDGVHEWSSDDLTSTARRIVAAGLRASPTVREGEDLPHLTDRAVLEGAAEADVAVDEAIRSWRRVAELPFEPARGYHAVLGRNGAGGLLCVKGAPEVLFPRCFTWAHPGGDRPLDARTRRRLEKAVNLLAQRGHRVLAVAERDASSRRDLDDDRVSRLRLLGFLGLVDPVRPEAADGVAQLHAAGLRVVMVTGDHPSTAEGIAAELGLRDGRRTLTGAELDGMSDTALDDVLDQIIVFARVTPAHKVRIVEAYRRRGTVVAMSGDGANDAPAIRLADVGVALGENATPAARSAADLVVPDGRIETITAAIVEGRSMWGSVRDALAIMLGGNLGEVGFTVAGTIAAGEPPLNPRQLLLVNLMTDVAPGLAVAVRPPRGVTPDELLHVGPDASLGAALDREIIARAVTTAVGAGVAWSAARLTGRARRASTVALAALVGTQLGQTLVDGGTDPLVAAAGLGSAAVLAGIIQTPGLSQFFGCTPLGPLGWSIALGTSTAATALSVVASPLLDRLPFARLGSPEMRPGEHAGESVEPFDGAVALQSP
jgi:cation-transporting ATPase I